MPKAPTLGERLRKLRQSRGLSLRDVEKRWGINSGYLSQLESDKISNPTPSMLKKLAEAYGEPLEVLMEWAGYIERDPAGSSPNFQRALNYLPDDISDKELEALKAVLDAMRGGSRATAYSPLVRSDLALAPERRELIRKSALAVLREMDAHRDFEPVDLEEALAVANLVRAGAIELSLDEKERLRDRFRGLVDVVLRNLQGVIHLGSREVFVQASLHELRERFVVGHEIGHGVLEDHRIVFAHLDDHRRLNPDYADQLEREANQFSIELLAKGDRLRQEFDGSRPSIESLEQLATLMSISKQATARRIAEESRQQCAVAMAWRSQDGRGPLWVDSYRLWTSTSFEQRFRWTSGLKPDDAIKNCLRCVASGTTHPPITLIDANDRPVEMRVEGTDARYSVFVLFAPAPGRRPLFKSFRGVPAPA